MQCPKCEAAFEKLDFRGIEIDRCTGCRGLWFDMLEKEDMLRAAGSEKIDIGNPEDGARYDKIRDIKCPRCQGAMVKMVDKDQIHVQFESCPGCYGTFFDAGEFADLKELTVLERFTKLLNTLRSNT